MILQPYTLKNNLKIIRASYNTNKEWKADPKGYFTIKPFADEGLIKVRFHNYEHEILIIIEGENAEEIYNTIMREELVSRLDHAAYLGSELQKAEIAMRNNMEYTQDDALKIQ